MSDPNFKVATSPAGQDDEEGRPAGSTHEQSVTATTTPASAPQPPPTRNDPAALAKRGIHVFPVAARSKKPLTEHGFKDATTDQAQIQAWLAKWPDCNWGIATGASGLYVVDVDPKNGGAASWDQLVKELGEGIADSVRVRTGGDGLHVYFKRPSGEHGNTTGALGPGIDTRGEGGYVVAPPSIHPSGKPYEWVAERSLLEVDPRPLPQVLVDLLARPKARGTQLGALVPEVIVAGGRNQALTSLAGLMHRKGMDAGAILAALQQQNQATCKPPLSLREVDQIVRSVTKYAKGVLPDVLVDAGEHDIGNGRRLVALYGHMFRFVHQWGFLVWDGRAWQNDTMGRMDDYGKKTACALRLAVDRVQEDEKRKRFLKHAERSHSRDRVAAMIQMARSEPGIDCRPEDFDKDPDLLNVRNGVIDLRDGSLKPHDPELYLRGFVDIDYDPAAVCPRWEAFVKASCVNDMDLVECLQRAFGYTLTGHVNEHVCFFLYGDGRNGKSVVCNILMRLLGDLAVPLGFEALLAGRDTKTSHELSAVIGKRMALATEAPEGRSFNEEAIKAMTGGEHKLQARQLYKDPVAFHSVVKVWMTGNNKPQIRGVNEAIWERFLLFPFQNHVPKHKRIKDLELQLVEELPGILAWAVRGAQAWRKAGLNPPRKVVDAVEEYRTDNDLVGQWIEETCTIGDGQQAEAGVLLKACNVWLAERHEREMNQNAFSRRIAKFRAGLLRKEKNGKGYIVWHGIALGKDLPAPVQGTLEAAVAAAPVAGITSSVDALHAQHDRMRRVQDLVRELAAQSDKGFVTHEQLEEVLGREGWHPVDVARALEALRRNNAIYCRGGSGTYAPLVS